MAVVRIADQDSFHFRHRFHYSCFLLAFTQLQSQSVVDGREFLKPESIHDIMAKLFPI